MFWRRKTVPVSVPATNYIHVYKPLPGNAPGKYYVDDSCLDCDSCRAIAPMIFVRNDSEGYSHVARQPENPAENSLCVEAMQGCPQASIRDDGHA